VVLAPVRNVGTCRPVAAVGSLDHWVPPAVARENPKQRELRRLSTDAGHRGGPSRSTLLSFRAEGRLNRHEFAALGGNPRDFRH
jgi:hypothetical protein